MKQIFTLLVGAALAVGQTQAAPKEDRGDRGRGHGQGNGNARAAAVSAQAPVQRASSSVRAVSNDARRAVAPTVTSTPRVTSNARVSSNNVVRSNDLRTGSQTAIRSADVSRNVTRDSSAARVTTRTNRDWDGRRGDWDGRRDHNNYSGGRYYRPPIDVYRGWDRGRVYSWNNHRYHWYGGSWVIYDSPTVIYSDDLPVVGASVAAEAQAELRRRGYYDGAVDGVIGPRTRDAIAEFQDDAGLAVTGRLTNSTLSALGIS
jgi:hypothetical protein